MIGFLIQLLAEPAVQTVIVMGLTALAGKISSSWANDVRWDKIVRIAGSVVAEIYSKGITDWKQIAVLAMRQIQEEVKAHPGIKNLSEREVERLKPFVEAFARRKNGVILKPME
jgi:hypothetical protein